MNIDYFYILEIVVVLVLAVWIFLIELRLKKFFKGKNAGDLESVLHNLTDELKKLNVSKEETTKYLETVERRLKQSIQHVGIVRFNPFGDAGSNQSFAIAFLDERGDGVVISSLYSRESVRIYAKPVKNRQSEYNLTEEEKEAIKKPVYES
jgi:hypothetical protein